MNFQWLVNSTMSFGTWLTLGVVLPIVTVLVSAGILARRGFRWAAEAESGR